MEVLNELKNLAKANLKSFNEKLIPNTYPILGVKIPELRALAKKIALNNYDEFLINNPCHYFEEVMLEGLVNGYVKCDINKHLELLKNYVSKITDWALCDCSVSTYKFVKSNLTQVWNFVLPYYNSNNEFYIRFAVIMWLDYFVVEDYIDKVLELLKNFSSNFYYAKMGVAWLLSVCFVKFRDKTLNFLINCKLDVFTFNKTISKCCESFRVTEQDKQLLKQLKKAQ